MRISINSSRDFFALLIRRKWWVVGTFVALTGALILLVDKLPPVFVSEATILIRPSDVSEPLVPRMLAQSTEQRLKAIEQFVLSRTNLVSSILNDPEFGDKLRSADLDMDEQVVKLRDQIRIMFELQPRSGTQLPMTYFKISYQNSDKNLAQKVAKKLTEDFIKQDADVTEKQIIGASKFFQDEVDRVAALLEDSEAKLRRIRSSELNTLPDSLELNLRTLDRLSAERKAISQTIDRIKTQILTLEQQITETPERIPNPVQPVRSVPPPVPTPIKPPQVTIKLPTQQDKLALQVQALADEVLRSRLEEFKKAKVELDEAMTNRTASHPDVVRAQGRLNKAKDQLPPELLAELLAPPKPATPKPETPSELAIVTAPAVDPVVPDPPAVAYVELPIDMIPNPLYRTYAGQLQQLKTEEKISLGERDSIIKEMDILNKRVKETPGTEQRIAEVLRENFDLKKQYEDYSGKLTQTRLAESLAVKQKGTQFHVIDPANNPDSPEKPRKSMLAMWAAAVSLLFAIVLAIVVDVTRQRVWAASEVEALWDVPVLVDIPEIAMEADAGVARKKWRRQVTAVMAGAVVYGVCMYGISVNHSFILSQLDPLVQRIVYR